MLGIYVLLGAVLSACASLAASTESLIDHPHFVFTECGDNDECWNKYKSVQQKEPGYVYQTGTWRSGGNWSLVQMDLDKLRAAGGKISLLKRQVTDCHIMSYTNGRCGVTYCWKESSGSTVTASLIRSPSGSLSSSEIYTLSDDVTGNYYTDSNQDGVRADLYWAAHGLGSPATRESVLNLFTPFCFFSQIFCDGPLQGNLVAWTTPDSGSDCIQSI